MGSSVLNIGVSGLTVAQAGLLTTSHNIANASTPGYNRQQAIQSTNEPNYTGVGFFGQGASVTTVRRMYNEYLTNQVLGAENNVGELDMYLQETKQIDNLLADTNAGLSPALSSFFQAVQQSAADPSSVPARQSMLSMAQGLAARFKSIDQRMGEIRDGVNTQLISEGALINGYAQQIAELNQRIVISQASGADQPANDLYDQRDLLVRELNKQVRVTAVPQGDGSTNIFIGTGQPLVVGTTTYTLLTDTASEEDSSRVSVRLKAPSGDSITIPEDLLQGGALGGLLRFRSETLDPAQNSLGKIALALAMDFNRQHQMGIDLTGAAGVEFFKTSGPQVLDSGHNSGTAMLTAAIYDADYRIDFGAGTITRLGVPPVDVTPVGGIDTSGNAMVIDGVSIKINLGTTPGPTDVFVIRPGAASGQRVISNSTNVGDESITVGASNLQSLVYPASDYRLAVTLSGLQLTRLTDGKVWNASDMSALKAQLGDDPQGFVLDWEGGTPGQIGDTFLIQPTRGGARDLSVAFADPRTIALASSFRTATTLTNKGTGRIDAGAIESLDSVGLPFPVTVEYDSHTTPGTPVLVLKDGAVPANVIGQIDNYVAGKPYTVKYNGISFTITGTPVDGDTFTLEKNVNGVSDNRNAVALGGLQTASTLSGNSASYQAAYGQIVSFIGNVAREKDVTMQAQQTLADQADNSIKSLSGVNLDEEAANLMKYQQAYQASAKIMSIANELFKELLSLGG